MGQDRLFDLAIISIEHELSSDDEEIDETDKDKDYIPTILQCNEDVNESLEDFPLDLAADNPPNILDFDFEKSGCSPEKYKITHFRELQGSDSVKSDKLFKIRPLLSHFQETYKTIYQPSRHLAVDESMVAFKGRSSMKQFMPIK
ncbi:uncharacterized protein LOC132925307 [Rhopalosiphum padi]|uniref:uncharacterized protein LOC132925307 n=1 Tax=Rhopalosiphum padi TaxID=40932 RepID=UPI00298DD594|nr:uncharacterized protein LOC132925307 [Rhopalosiphum padi]